MLSLKTSRGSAGETQGRILEKFFLGINDSGVFFRLLDFNTDFNCKNNSLLPNY